MPAPDHHYLVTTFSCAVRVAVLLAVLVPAGRLLGAPLPVVFVVDAAMSQQNLTAATEITLETSSQLADETAFSIVVYDDVIQKVVPLGTMGTERLALIKQTLDNTVSAPTSNLAAGMERAQDEVKKLPGGRIILFTSAQINTETTDNQARYLEWYKNVLLPDAAEQGLMLVFVTPASTEDNALLQLAQSYQNTRIVALQPADDATSALLELLNGPGSGQPAATAPEIKPVAPVAAEEPIAPADAGDNSSAPAATHTPITTDEITTDEMTADELATDRAATDWAATDRAATEPGLLQNRRMLHIIWYACLFLALLCLCGWLVWTQRQRRSTEKRAVPAENSQTGSAYLPLSEMPSRRFDSLANSIDKIEPYEQWTAQSRTARQAPSDPAARPPRDKKN